MKDLTTLMAGLWLPAPVQGIVFMTVLLFGIMATVRETDDILILFINVVASVFAAFVATGIVIATAELLRLMI